MAETIREVHGQQGWQWYQVMADLKEIGGLANVVINPLSVKRQGACGGTTEKGTVFYITWAHNTYLLVTMSQNEKELIEAFSKVVEYKPFCQYLEDSKETLVTFEWDKIDPTGRFEELQKKPVRELQKLT
jgi:hypothetical protein